MNIRACILATVLLAASGWVSAQGMDGSKMSPWVRQVARKAGHSGRTRTDSLSLRRQASASVCAFVLVGDNGGESLEAHGCRSLAQFGNIHIADIPLGSLGALSLDRRILRIEAHQGSQLHMDRVPGQVGAAAVHLGEGLPQAYSGRGVVMGVMDVGFDLTHPNFYDAAGEAYRIGAFWDQLSTETEGSPLYVGADYVGREALLRYAHSRDAMVLTHGTHTLGCAAGSGGGSAYRGMAPESEICIVNNAVGSDRPFIPEEDLYKYTYATDALGFKYIFDYAESKGMPCVISFSEGSGQDFRGFDVLYDAVLDSLTSKPGRVIVSSAGNEGWHNTYFRKPRGTASAGSFLQPSGRSASFTLKGSVGFDLRLKAYEGETPSVTTLSLPGLLDATGYAREVVAVGTDAYSVEVEGFPSCYDETETAYEVTLTFDGGLGQRVPFSIELVGAEADVEFYLGSGELVGNERDATLCAGEPTHSIKSPACCESIVCVGGTTYSTGITNYLGEFIASDWGPIGERGTYSSVGPTFDGRLKPDVMAPGIDVVSSLSSYYIEGSPNGSDLKTCVEMFDRDGRTYGWTALSGTSMSAPIVGGAVALWLEANPNLTREDIFRIISETSTQPDASMAYPNNLYGYGQVDVYKGLLAALDLLGIEGLAHRQPRQVRIGADGPGQIVVAFDAVPTQDFGVKVYDLTGRCLLRQAFRAGEQTYRLALAGCPRGVYAVQVDSPAEGQGGSSLVRLE